MRPHHVALEGEGAGVKARHEGDAGLRRHRVETHGGVSAPQVSHRTQCELLPGRRQSDPGFDHDRHLADRFDGNGEVAIALGPTVAHGEGDILLQAPIARVGEDDESVGLVAHLVGAARRGRDQVEGISVWVDPVADHLRRDTPTLGDRCLGHPHLLRR